MPIDLQSLSTDTLLYMLLHSGVFVAIMGVVFFLIGLIFGFATWGRHKNRSRVMAAEIALQREEIATLKRKLGDQNVKPGSTQIATETISMPTAATPAPAPAKTPAELPPPSPSLPPEIITDTISSVDLAPAAETAVNGAAAVKTKPGRPKNVVKARNGEAKAPVESVPAPAVEPVITPVPADGAAPPALLSGGDSAGAHSSPLAAIIAPPSLAPVKSDKPAADTLAADAAALDIIPALPELPPAPPPSAIKPEMDARLGLVYKTRPAHSDDLTAMKGIARVLEQRLHEFGIYTYLQIASWTDEHIREFSSRLAFKDRIHREKWVEQAKRLHAEKHGVNA